MSHKYAARRELPDLSDIRFTSNPKIDITDEESIMSKVMLEFLPIVQNMEIKRRK